MTLSARQQVAYGVLSIVLAVMLSSGFAVWYSGYQNQKWCEALGIFTRQDPRTLPPPSTPLGKEQREGQIETYDALKRLKDDFHCN